MSRESGRSLSLVALVLALGTLIASGRIIAGGETWSDVRYHTEIAPPRLAAAQQIQAGELPAWWDGTGLGVPLAGEPSHGAMAPAIWLATSPRALDLILVAHLFWLALGIAVWARRTTSETAAVVAGLLAITCGVIGGTAIRGALPSLAHLPWLGAAASMRGRRSAIAIGAALGAIGLGGQLAVLVDGIALVLVLDRRRGTIAAIGCGLAISLAQWLPALLALPHAAGFEVQAMPLSRLVELVVPGSFGAVDPDRGIVAIGGAAAWAPSVFLGVPLLALAAVRPIARSLLGLVLALAALALVAGRGGWPGWLGAPELHLAVLAVVLAPLAAEGVEALVAGERRARLALAIGGGCALVALGALAIYRGGHDEAHAAIDRALVDGALGLACLTAAVAVVRVSRLVPLALALLVAPGFGAMRSTSPTTARPDKSRWAELAEDEQPPRRLYRPESLHDGDPRHFEPLDDALATLAGASPDRWGITAARSDDPARARWHDRTWLAASHGGGVLLDRFGVGLAILPRQVTDRMTMLATRGRWVLVQWPIAPVASVVSGARYQADPERALGMLFSPDGRSGLPRGTIVIAGSGDSHDSSAPPRPCQIARWEAGAIDLRCTGPGFAVVSSSAADGWTATVDGAEAAALDADVLRRAVAIGAGPHAIAWRYTAPGMLAGLVLALLGILGLAILVTRSYMQRRASRASS